ncbi:MAG TPA: DUF302 domain-containing protein [Gammaproteobacteria bacterium]|jgi:uncharacterized protein (DUF302 family)|nr:DUF302 domain-containing protein [Gammaproteobacteria bacterium]
MFKLLWNLLALLGLVMVAGLVWTAVVFDFGTQNIKDLGNLSSFDDNAPKVYTDMFKSLVASGNGAEATIWKVPVADGLSVEDVEQTMRFVANEHNIKNVGELPLSEQVAAMTGEPQRYLKIYMFCNPLTAAKMVDYSDAFSAYLPCRISLVEDKTGKLWIYTLNMDMMIHGGTRLPDELFEEANTVKDVILDIMNRGAAGDF